MKHLEIYLDGVRPRLLHRADEQAFWLNHWGTRLECTSLREWFAARNEGGLQIRPHMLRRACATELLRSGASPWIVKELLGHDDLQTIEHYALLDLADIQEMHARCHPRDRASFGKLEPRTLE